MDKHSFGNWRFGAVCLILLTIGLLLFACMADDSTLPASQSPGNRGIAVAPEFERFYQENGGLRTFGYPISGPCHETDERLIQYYQHMRLDFDPARPASKQVAIFPLGEWAFQGQSPVAELAPVPGRGADPAATRYFPETKQSVQGAFLAFYEANEGERLLGAPLSPQMDEGELRVQYFRNGRLEWRPDEPVALRVQLGRLGERHYVYYQASGVACGVVARPDEQLLIREANVSATLKESILFAGDEQVVYVRVTNPEGQPARGLEVVLAVTANGETRRLTLPKTDSAGQTQAEIQFDSPVPGEEVQVNVTTRAATGHILDKTLLTFKTWW